MTVSNVKIYQSEHKCLQKKPKNGQGIYPTIQSISYTVEIATNAYNKDQNLQTVCAKIPAFLLASTLWQKRYL